MIYHMTGYELLWLFFFYSFAGWVFETIVATIKQRRFANRGLINGPFCIIYGIAAIVMSVGLQELSGIWLFLFAAILATVVEWTAGHLIEKIAQERWWDYSDVKWNLDGYICLPVSALWGAFGYIVVRWGNLFVLWLYSLCPDILMYIMLWILAVTLAVDISASYILLKGKSKWLDNWAAANNQIENVSASLGNWIRKHVEYRIQKAYPKSKKAEIIPKDKTVFAQGCDFYKIVLLFFIGAFLGDITETIYCRITTGMWMSRSSVVWGAFSVVWGLGIALVTALLYKYKDRPDGFLFWMGTFLGGAYEYLCSVFTEIVFGKVFWDYSQMPFNLGGRVNLLYCFFWGIAAVTWFKKMYPWISNWIEKIPVKPGKIITWLLVVFMCCNVLVSSLALIRYGERAGDIPAENELQEWLDEQYNDEKMEKIYPNAKDVI